MAPLTWDQLKPEIYLRNVLVLEAEQHLECLEAYNKREITLVTYDTTHEQVMGTINKLKVVHAAFRQNLRTINC